MVDININKDSGYAPKDEIVIQTKGVWQSKWFEIDATESDVDITKNKPYKFIVTTPKGEKYRYKVKVITERVE